MLLGAHESIAGGLERAFALAEVDGCEAIQIFTKTSGQWREPVVDADRIAAFRDARGQSSIARAPVLAHGSYLLNLCTADAALIERSRVALVNEVLRCDALGVDQAIFHPGAHLGDGARAGVERAVEGLAWVLERTRGARTALVLENNAGQGSCVGAPFSELGAIVRGIDELCGDESRARVGVCIDTCHAFAAGYDLSTDAGYDAAFAELDRELGVARVRSMHLNDSKKPLGSRVDRHERPGEGEMGLRPFARLLADPRFASVVGVVELPPTEVRRGREVRVIKPLLDGLRGLVAPARRTSSKERPRPAGVPARRRP